MTDHTPPPAAPTTAPPAPRAQRARRGRGDVEQRSSKRRPRSWFNAPPPYVAPRVDAGGEWGPTPFNLPRRAGDRVPRLVALGVLLLAAVLLVGVGWLFYMLGR